MRTLLFLVAGLVAGAVFHARRPRRRARRRHRLRTVRRRRGPPWPAWNLYEGVAHAGYTVLEELPIFLVIALVPIGAIWWLARRRT